MRLRHRVLPLSLALLPLLLVAPAHADTSGTTGSIVVLGGPLVITVADRVLTLAHGAGLVEPSTVSGRLGQVEVEDARGAAADSGWIVNVRSTGFVAPGGPGPAVAAVGYQAGPITQVGTATVTVDRPPGPASVLAAVTTMGIVGHHTATWNPTITLTLPGEGPAADFTVTITHSVT